MKCALVGKTAKSFSMRKLFAGMMSGYGAARFCVGISRLRNPSALFAWDPQPFPLDGRNKYLQTASHRTARCCSHALGNTRIFNLRCETSTHMFPSCATSVSPLYVRLPADQITASGTRILRAVRSLSFLPTGVAIQPSGCKTTSPHLCEAQVWTTFSP